MMEGSARDEIRSLLKEFGVRADEAIVTHLARNPGIEHLQLRIVLEDLTSYDARPPSPQLTLTVEGDINRSTTA
jgi:hypothetical protein